LRQEGANRDAIGAWLEVRVEGRVIRHEITSGGGHASGQLGWRHFGLGEAASAEARVVWPDGETSEWQTVKSDRFYVLARGKAPAVWHPN
jgi:enediyne biosynthesis protein E4